MRITQILILVGALAASGSLFFLQSNAYQLASNAFVALALAAAAGRPVAPVAAGVAIALLLSADRQNRRAFEVR